MMLLLAKALTNRLFLLFVMWSFALIAPLSRAADSQKSETKSEPLERISIQLKWFHQFQFAGYYAAIEKGYFRQEGLEVTLLERDPNQGVIDKVLNGGADYGVSDSALILAKLNQKPVLLVSQIFQHSPLVFFTLEKNNLRAPIDLVGKKLMFEHQTGDHIQLTAMLNDVFGSVKDLEVLPLSYNIDSLIKGQVDALAGYLTSQGYDLNERGVDYSVIDPKLYGFDFYGDNLFTSLKEAERNKSRVEKVQRAVIRGWQYALDNKAEIIELIREKYNPQLSVGRLAYEAKLIDTLIEQKNISIGNLSSRRLKEIGEAFVGARLAASASGIEKIVFNRTADYQSRKMSNNLNLTPEEYEWLSKHPVFRVMNEPDYVPYDFVSNGKPTGFSIDYVKLIAEKLDIKLSFVQAEFPRLIDKAKNREIDLMHSLFMYPDERKLFLNFTKPYKSAVNVIVTRKGEEPADGLKSMSENKVASVPGDAASGLLKNQFPEIERVAVSDYEEALVSVAMGKADATLLELPTANYLIKKLLINNLSVATPLEVKQEVDYRYRLAVRKDWPEFIPILEKAMDSITIEEMNEIDSRWMGNQTFTSSETQYASNESFNYIVAILATVLFLILVSIVLFYFLDKLKYSATLQVSSQYSGTRTAIVFNLILIGIVFSLGVWAISKIRTNIIENTQTALYTIKRSTLEALHIWVDDQKKELATTANDGQLVFSASQVVSMHEQGLQIKGSPEMAKIRQYFSSLKERSSTEGFFLIARDGTSIASMRDENIGTINLLKLNAPNLFERALLGDAVFVPPIPSDVPLEGAINIKGHSVPPTMFFLHPVKEDGGEVIAVLAERYDPNDKFSQINQLGRIGETGETYTFNEQGLLLTQSRFQSQLLDIGLIDSLEQGILSIAIKDPGKPLQPGEYKEIDTLKLPLTKMAKSAISGVSEMDMRGYRDYRGVQVIGTWSWDEDLNLGIATEIDLEEALGSYFVARNVVITTLGITVAISMTLTIIIMLLGRRTNKFLIDARAKLEESVKERTEELKLSEERFELAMRGANDGLWDWNFKTGEVYYSKRWAGMLGYQEEELAPKLDTWMSLCHPEDSRETLQLIEACELGEQDSFNIEFRMKHKEGYWVPILSRAYVCRDPENNEVTRIVGTHIDLTERKAMESDLLLAKEQAESASKMKSEFLAGMSHEIRTPMNGVIGMLRQMLQHELTDKQKERAEIASGSAKSLLSLINDILDFSKIEAGKLSIEKTEFDLKNLMLDAIKSFNAVIEEKGLNLKTEFHCMSNHQFVGDPSRIRQILVNLISNALKFTEKGDIIIRGSCENITDDRWQFKCEVEDSGIGIPADKLNILFDSFTQVDASTTRKFGGTGLGLAICSQLTRLMGGDIYVESEEGRGSCFKFSVSLDAGSEVAEEIHIESSTDETKALQEKLEEESTQEWPEDANVLLVEDHMVNLIVAEGLMEEFGLSFASAENGVEALKKLNEHQGKVDKLFTLILMDCEMPEMDGYETTRAIRRGEAGENYKNIPIVAMTAHAMAGAKEKCLSVGMNDYLSKPIDGAKLFEKCREWLNSRYS